MTIIVTDQGFAPAAPDTTADAVLDLAADADANTVPLTPARIRIAFASFGDGRGFTLARRLRLRGYAGQLRACGHVLADQYAMARRAGFDDVQISDDLAARQPEPHWLARADWRTNDYQARLRG